MTDLTFEDRARALEMWRAAIRAARGYLDRAAITGGEQA